MLLSPIASLAFHVQENQLEVTTRANEMLDVLVAADVQVGLCEQLVPLLSTVAPLVEVEAGFLPVCLNVCMHLCMYNDDDDDDDDEGH